MGAENSSMSGGASSRGWSGSSYSTTSDPTTLSPPHLIRRMSNGGAGSVFPSLKLTDTLLPNQKANPAQPTQLDESAKTDLSNAGAIMHVKMASPTTTKPSVSPSLSSTSDIPQPLPAATIDDFAPGEHPRHPHHPHVTWMTHPWHKSTKAGSSAQQQPPQPSRATSVKTFSRKVLAESEAMPATSTSMTTAASAPSTTAAAAPEPFLSSTLAPLKLQRRMSTGSMLPPKENPFDAQPDELHRQIRLGRYYAPNTDGAAGASATPPRRMRAASFSAEAADRFAGGFPW